MTTGLRRTSARESTAARTSRRRTARHSLGPKAPRGFSRRLPRWPFG